MNKLSAASDPAAPRISTRFTAERELAKGKGSTGSSSAAKLKTHTIFQDQFVKVVSDDKLTQAQGAALAKKIEDAYKFDTKSLGWTDSAPLTAKPLTVEALTKAGFDNVLGGDSSGVAGVTMGPQLMAVPENLTDSTNPDDDDTIAHELTHVQDFRELGKADPDAIPVYLEEGKAYSIGDSYPIALGEDGRDPVLHDLATSLTQWTAADAQDVMDHYRTGNDEDNSGKQGFRDEVMGALYVQFLKVHGNNGAGFPDIMQRLSQVYQAVGAGSSYEAAFQKQFGVSSKATETAFVKFVGDTQNDPQARLAGTIWAPYLNAPATAHAARLAA